MTGEILTGGRRSGKTRQVEDEFEKLALGMDPAACGCATGVLVGRGTDGTMTVVREVGVKCAAHDVIEGVVVPKELPCR